MIRKLIESAWSKKTSYYAAGPETHITMRKFIHYDNLYSQDSSYKKLLQDKIIE